MGNYVSFIASVLVDITVDAQCINQACNEFRCEPLKQCEGITCSFTLQPYSASLLAKSASLLAKSASQGGNVLGLDGPLVSILALTWWMDRADDEKITKTFKNVIEAIDRDAASRGTAVPFKYLNYAWDFQDPIKSYSVENRQFLQEVSRKFDPEGLFQKGVRHIALLGTVV